MYRPPFSITSEMIQRSLSIAAKAERFSSYQSLRRMPTLRRNNRIESLHSSLAIEANSLSLGQVRDVIDGKTVIGPKKEIQEVKNAYDAYSRIDRFDPYDENDLLEAHGILTRFLETESGVYRAHGEGVRDEIGNVIHIAPSERMVPTLMKQLFAWLREDEETPLLIKSCVFHYEFVFIHPFGDGNGRTARLWQTALLAKWNPLFAYIPIESRIYACQSDYYAAIAASNHAGDSTAFIEFMLKMIDEALDETLVGAGQEAKSISEQVSRLLDVLEPDIPLSANEIMKRLGVKSKETLRASYLNPAIENGLVKMTLPDKPKSKNQKYYK